MPEVTADLADQVGVGGAARPGPHPHRDPVAGDRHPDHHLRQIIARVLGLPVRAEPGLLDSALVALLHALAVLIARHRLISLAGLEIRRGRVKEQQIDFEVQQVGDLEIGRFRQVRLDGQQVVHRPVARLLIDLIQAVDVHIVRDPAGRGELR